MAGAIIIVTALGVLFLVLAGYLLVGSILVSGNTLATSQKDMVSGSIGGAGAQSSISLEETHWHDCRAGHFHYNIWGNCYEWHCTTSGNVTHFWVLNGGDQPIGDLSDIEAFVSWGTDTPYRYINGSGSEGTRTYYRVGIYKGVSDSPIVEEVNIGMWDPGEYLFGRFEVGVKPDAILVVLPDGGEDLDTDIEKDTIVCP